MSPRRINLSLFDDELKGIINASSKIFPISEEDVINNINAGGYEYGRVGRSLYVWEEGAWRYLIADDIDISWSDIHNKPITYPPSEHNHGEMHEHTNKSLLDSITQVVIDTWNNAVTHISDSIKHITSNERTLWNTVSNKADNNHQHNYAELEHIHDDRYYNEDEIDLLLSDKSSITHNHDGAYYKKTEVDDKLSNKSNVSHMHSDLHTHNNKSILDSIISSELQDYYDLSQLEYIEDIRNGYTEGHQHSNFVTLENISDSDVANWNNASVHIIDESVHIQIGERAIWNTVSNKSDIDHTHDYSLSTHLHDDRYYTEQEIDLMLASKSDSTHIHDDRYYTESEVDSKLALKSDVTTVNGHINNSIAHVTAIDKSNWNDKTRITISSSQPTDSSLWYDER